MVEGVRRTMKWDRAAISSRTSAAVHRRAVGRFRPLRVRCCLASPVDTAPVVDRYGRSWYCGKRGDTGRASCVRVGSSVGRNACVI